MLPNILRVEATNSEIRMIGQLLFEAVSMSKSIRSLQ